MDGAGVFSQHLTKGVALNRQLLTSPHVVGDFHQPFDEASLATDDGVNVLTDQHIGVDGGAPDRARNHAIVLQDIQRAIHEQGNHV